MTATELRPVELDALLLASPLLSEEEIALTFCLPAHLVGDASGYNYVAAVTALRQWDRRHDD